MPEQVQQGASVPEVETEEILEFIVGFPCSQFACHGNIQCDTHRDRPAVSCSVCEHLYYMLSED